MDARVLIHLVASISVRASPSRIVNLLLRSCRMQMRTLVRAWIE